MAHDANGRDIDEVISLGGILKMANITAATLVRAGPGRAVRVNVIVAGSAAGSVNDCATTGAAATANATAAIPNTLGSYMVDMPHALGIVVVPGTGQTLCIAYI